MPNSFTLKDLEGKPCYSRNTHLFAEVKAKKAKYNNKKVVIDGLRFDSKKEAARYLELRALQMIGEISELKCQVPFQLSVCKYIADFQYKRNGLTIVEDVKGYRTDIYRMKRKMMFSELSIQIQEI